MGIIFFSQTYEVWRLEVKSCFSSVLAASIPRLLLSSVPFPWAQLPRVIQSQPSMPGSRKTEDVGKMRGVLLTPGKHIFPKYPQQTSTYISLARTVSHGHPSLQEQLRNIVCSLSTLPLWIKSAFSYKQTANEYRGHNEHRMHGSMREELSLKKDIRH